MKACSVKSDKQLLKRTGRMFAGLFLLVALCAPSRAHEFWLEPETYRPSPMKPVKISIRIGQKFKGDSYPFIKSEFKKFVLLDAGGQSPVKGVDGDDPALTQRFGRNGLAILVHHSTAEKLTFETYDKFLAYLELEGLNGIAARHAARGLPAANIRESYSRCAKLLVAVGGVSSGEDRLSGLMPIELVAETNPYRLRAGAELVLRLYHLGKPLADTQVTAISRGQPERRLALRTDEAGRVRITLDDAGPWLFNAVHMFDPAADVDADWESLWASLTLDVAP